MRRQLAALLLLLLPHAAASGPVPAAGSCTASRLISSWHAARRLLAGRCYGCWCAALPGTTADAGAMWELATSWLGQYMQCMLSSMQQARWPIEPAGLGAWLARQACAGSAWKAAGQVALQHPLELASQLIAQLCCQAAGLAVHQCCSSSHWLRLRSCTAASQQQQVPPARAPLHPCTT